MKIESVLKKTMCHNYATCLFFPILIFLFSVENNMLSTCDQPIKYVNYI